MAAGGAIFNDVHLNGVDQKGRVSLPAAFRQTIEIRCNGGKVAPGLEKILRMSRHPDLPCIEVSDARQVADHEEQMHARAEHIAGETGRFHGDILEEEEAKAYPLMKDVNFDAAGRMILPERLRIKAEIGEEAFFVGRGRRFRIWNPDILRKTAGGETADVIEEMEELLARRKERG
ncbi:MAG: division/cell wall cluster transcriptional repressor MraZ [Sphingomonadales bacterium]|nr:MAG: division/cell wall cluster transcriptional repressor MraZ [Sphingomonadales bacterium]